MAGTDVARFLVMLHACCVCVCVCVFLFAAVFDLHQTIDELIEAEKGKSRCV